LCDRADNLSRLGPKLWIKQLDQKTLRGKRWRGSWGNKIEWEILIFKIEDGIRLIK